MKNVTINVTIYVIINVVENLNTDSNTYKKCSYIANYKTVIKIHFRNHQLTAGKVLILFLIRSSFLFLYFFFCRYTRLIRSNAANPFTAAIATVSISLIFSLITTYADSRLKLLREHESHCVSFVFRKCFWFFFFLFILYVRVIVY